MNPTKFRRTRREDFPGEAPAFDCIEAIKPHIGYASWEDFLRHISDNRCAHCVTADCLTSFGLEGFPVECLYDLVFGQGAYARELPEHTKAHIKRAYEEGKATGLAMQSAKQDGFTMYDGPPEFLEDFVAGLEDATGVRAHRYDLGEKPQ